MSVSYSEPSIGTAVPATPAPTPPVPAARPVRHHNVIRLASHRPAALAPQPAAPASPAAEPIRVDRDRHQAYVAGRELELTYLEFQLLAHLVENPHRVHSREHLMAAVWDYAFPGDGRTVDVHVARLRRKLGAAHRAAIVTVRRVGYKFVPPAPDHAA
jgi:DNA-binding response OmpR family regulator